MRRFLVLVSFLCAVAAAGCGEAPSGSDESTAARQSPYTVVATTSMVGDLVRNIAGDRAEVRTLMGEGVDPHLYKSTRSDVAAMLGADIIFYNGLLLEGKMTDALVRVATGGKPVHAVTELIDEEFLLEPEEFQGHFDPHVWMDPVGWARAAEAVAAKLIEFDPAGRTVYEANLAAHIAELDRLHEYATRVLGSIPEQTRALITAHDAFNYLARRYNLEVRGIQGISTESEAGVRDIEQLVSLLVDRGIPAVFTETTVADRNVRALIAGAAARGHTVALGTSLYSDAMGAPGTYEGTHVGMIDHNVTAIARGLGGEAPAGGMNGRLTGVK